jgi:hypothetical protein
LAFFYRQSLTSQPVKQTKPIRFFTINQIFILIFISITITITIIAAAIVDITLTV